MKPAEASLPSDTEVLVKRSFDAPVKLVWRACCWGCTFDFK